mmetsp:Transcript_36368/g.44872  ORF Transcript_36368/g.44872 Transcript_36368/m.44872 type:complete len:235 (-) Transcript_36368:536-1240(-)
MLLADALHQGLKLAVLQGRHVWEHVVLNLIVEPSISDVNQIVSTFEVGGRVGTTEQKLCGVSLARGRVPVEIATRMVAGDDDKGMGIGQHVCHHRRDQCTQRSLHGRTGTRPQAQAAQHQRPNSRQRHGHEHRQNCERPLGKEGHPEEGIHHLALHQGLQWHAQGVKDHHWVGLLGPRRPIQGQPAVLLGQRQLLVGIGRIVGKLPGEHPEEHGRVFQHLGERHGTQQLEVVLH